MKKYIHEDGCGVKASEPCTYEILIPRADYVVVQVRRCIVHDDIAGPKDSHCRYWWWANGGDPKAGLATPCKWARPKERTDD